MVSNVVSGNKTPKKERTLYIGQINLGAFPYIANLEAFVKLKEAHEVYAPKQVRERQIILPYEIILGVPGGDESARVAYHREVTGKFIPPQYGDLADKETPRTRQEAIERVEACIESTAPRLAETIANNDTFWGGYLAASYAAKYPGDGKPRDRPAQKHF